MEWGSFKLNYDLNISLFLSQNYHLNKKCGTQIKDSLNINHGKFVVSNPNSLALPTAQVMLMLITFELSARNTFSDLIALYDI